MCGDWCLQIVDKDASKFPTNLTISIPNSILLKHVDRLLFLPRRLLAILLFWLLLPSKLWSKPVLEEREKEEHLCEYPAVNKHYSALATQTYRTKVCHQENIRACSEACGLKKGQKKPLIWVVLKKVKQSRAQQLAGLEIRLEMEQSW
jgi:hypothetical protein